ncbi:MAG TPA: hypothetical protein DCQ92_19170 [Verrucomicrobia subdivision 3 bacterium]|nr:hypothetical protein [Limisphaerales bacterium]
MTTNEQLELGFNGSQGRHGGAQLTHRMTRAKWWFAQMRAAVADAMDWQAVNEPRPEQMWMPGANRQLKG